MRFLKVILTVSVILSAYLGDYVVFHSKYSSSLVFRAFTDSLVHAAIGCVSSAVFFSYEHDISVYACMLNILFCTIVSSLIDVDHIIAARSFHFKNITALKEQGIFHCSTLWMVVTTLMLAYSYLTRKLNIFLLTFMSIIAFTSHHVRDANRRGLWFYPLGHTAPLSKPFYVCVLAVLPHALAYVYLEYKREFYKSVIVNYEKYVVQTLSV